MLGTNLARARVTMCMLIMKSSGYSVFRLMAILVLFGATFRPDMSRAQRPLGTDVSGYQPAIIDWTTVKNAGVKFGWTKATEGTGYVNPNFVSQINGATSIGIYMGIHQSALQHLHP